MIAALHTSLGARQVRRLRDGHTRIARCWFSGDKAPYPTRWRRGQLEFRDDALVLADGRTGDAIVLPAGGLTVWGVDVPDDWSLSGPKLPVPRMNYLILGCHGGAGEDVRLLMPEPLSLEVWRRLNQTPDSDL